ncbi:MAG TPA: phage tail tube protein [Terracidiphilus sp.]
MSTATIEPPTSRIPPGAAKAVTSCPANVQETRIAFGYAPQADVSTANLIGQMWSLTKVNPAVSVLNPVNETNALDIGKGNEFPSQVFPSYQDASVALEKYASSEFLAWLFCFTTGKATKTGTAATGVTYAAVPNDPAVDCINLPTFSWDEQIRPTPNSVIDRMLIGCVVGDWTLTMQSGPGRANCRVSCNLPGSGHVQVPGLSPLPAITQEHFLNAAGATITINGVDYVLSQSFISSEFRWNNNVRLDTGLYPGSGTQNGYAVRGRMEYGIREMMFSFVARAQKGSTEYNNLINGVEGTATIGVQGALIAGTLYHSFQIQMPRVRMQSVVNGDDNNIVTVQCGVTLLQPTDGVTPIVTLTATCIQDGILGL